MTTATRVKLCLLLSATLFAADAGAQRSRAELGIGVDWRTQLGALQDSVDRRSGLSVRLQADIPWKRHVGFRLEGAWVQVQYQRFDELGAIPISETSFEAGGYVRAFRSLSGMAQPYVLAGAVASYRTSCEFDDPFGTNASFVSCGGGADFLVGWGAGAGLRFANWVGGWNWFIESRLLSNNTAGAGSRLFTISIGAGM